MGYWRPAPAPTSSCDAVAREALAAGPLTSELQRDAPGAGTALQCELQGFGSCLSCLVRLQAGDRSLPPVIGRLLRAAVRKESGPVGPDRKVALRRVRSATT